MNFSRMQSRDLLTAAIPTALAVSLGEVHTIIGIAGGVLGISYLIWKWRTEYLSQRNPAADSKTNRVP